MTDHPCEDCNTRKYYARAFDIHFFGADCPYECELYDRWKEQEEREREDGKASDDA